MNAADVVDLVKTAETKRTQGHLKDVFVLTGEWHSKLGKALGQEFRPDSPFGARIFCNGSGRRRAEASSVATMAADFTLTKVLSNIIQEVRRAFAADDPYRIAMSLAAADRLDHEAEVFVSKTIPNITGVGATDPTIHEQLVAEGRSWADHVLEPLTVKILAILFIFVTVSLHVTPVVWVSWAAGLLGIMVQGGSLSFGDGLVYATLFWSVPYGVRWLQNRTVLARTGGRSIVIVSPVWKLLRNYVERLWGEGWGDLTPAVDGRNAEDLVNDKAAAVVRGTLLFVQMDDKAPMAEGQVQEGSATNMAMNQANGIQNYSVGPEIMLIHQNPNVSTTFTSLALQTPEQMADQPDPTLDPVAHELISSRFRYMELLASGQVFFAAMADKTARFDLELYRKTGVSRCRKILQVFIGGFFAILGWLLSKSLVGAYSFISARLLGSEPTRRLFVPGATQSGTAVATTQMTPDRSGSGPTKLEGRDIALIASQISEYGARSAPGKWVPRAGDSQIAKWLAHSYDPANLLRSRGNRADHWGR